MAERLDPSVVVMDINMPKIKGIEATSRILAGSPDVTVIGLSVNAGGDTHQAIIAAGAAVLLTKEAAAEQLHQTIHGAVRRITRPLKS